MIFYAISVALILAGCFVFYKILLQRETFFPLNRFILLACLALSFGLPLIPVPQQFSFRKAEGDIPLIKPVLESGSSEHIEIKKDEAKRPIEQQKVTNSTARDRESFFKDISILKIILWVYWSGVIVFTLNFLFQLVVLLYRVYSRPFIQDGKFRIVEVAGEQAPCSFANNILINPEKYDWDTYSQIILHEKIHIQQGHSYDIIFAEVALIFQWFNPFAWLYRKAMEDNLEFLTDSELLQHSDIEPQSYQMSLVKVSAPNFPASLTTNYNQSILKRRLIMMNAKKSNINSTWKYLCIVPLLLIFVSLLNEPIALGNTANASKGEEKFSQISNKGNWFATIKGDKIKIRFEDEDDSSQKNNSNTEIKLAELSNLPKDQKGNFTLTRDAGTMHFYGKFDGNTGMGTYEFKENETFLSFLKSENIILNKDKDALIFFLVNVKKDFILTLKSLNYTDISKNDLIPLTALNVTGPYIKSLSAAGLQDLSLQDLIPLKALDVNAAYINDIKKSGYKNLTAQKLVTLKAQGIDGEFIKDAKNATATNAAKAAVSNADPELPVSHTVSKKTNHKTTGDDDEDSEFGMMIAKKVLNVSAEYARSFAGTNLKLNDETLLAFKALGITAEYVKGFESFGIKLTEDDVTGMKATGLTPSDYKAYTQFGFKNLAIGEMVGAKATGTTPSFIANMKKKGHNFSTIDKYIAMKVTAVGDN